MQVYQEFFGAQDASEEGALLSLLAQRAALQTISGALMMHALGKLAVVTLSVPQEKEQAYEDLFHRTYREQVERCTREPVQWQPVANHSEYRVPPPDALKQQTTLSSAVSLIHKASSALETAEHLERLAGFYAIDPPVDTESEYREVRLICGLDPATGEVRAWAQGVLERLDPSCYLLEVHGHDLHLLPPPADPPISRKRRRLEGGVNHYEWQFRPALEYEQRLYDAAHQLAEQIRRQIRAGELPQAWHVSIPPGLEDIYHPIIRRMFEEEGIALKDWYAFESPLEELFWNAWHRLYPDGSFKLIPQYRIAHYRVDFAEVATKTVVEVDGAEYHSGTEAITRDRQRERAIERLGWHVVRFGGREVYREAERCMNELAAILSSRAGELRLGYS